VNWLRRLFRRDSAPPWPPPERPDQIDPLAAETAVHWSAEDQEVVKDEPPERRDDPNP
jgi:hypothetical protein